MIDNPKHIICIDNEPEMIELLYIILRSKGYEVSGATDGKTGLQMVQESFPDLVLLDLMMTDMSGWDVYHQLKADEKTKQIPVIIVTAKAQSIDKVLGLHIARVSDYITKPFSPSDLVTRVNKVLTESGHA